MIYVQVNTHSLYCRRLYTINLFFLSPLIVVCLCPFVLPAFSLLPAWLRRITMDSLHSTQTVSRIERIIYLFKRNWSKRWQCWFIFDSLDAWFLMALLTFRYVLLNALRNVKLIVQVSSWKHLSAIEYFFIWININSIERINNPNCSETHPFFMIIFFRSRKRT